jgi:hypothetical protein
MAPTRKTVKLSVKFHTGVYTEAAVKEAALACRETADIRLSRRGAYIEAAFAPKGALPDNFLEEFANLALANSI